MIKLDKLTERIEMNIEIKYSSPIFVKDLITYLNQKTTEIHPTVNITFEKNEHYLKINLECTGAVETFLKTLDMLLIHIREKEELQNKKKL